VTVEDFVEDPLDLFEDDCDGVIEMGLFFDKDKQSEKKPPGGGGCCVVLLGMGTSILMVGLGIMKLIA